MALNLSLEGRTAVVTGGASGIGRATAALLAEADANVTIFDIAETGGDIAASMGADFVHCDMADYTKIDQAYEEVIGRNGNVNILVNNVGVSTPAGILETPTDDTARMEVINVGGPLHLTRLVMNGMIQRREKNEYVPGADCVTFVGSTQAHVVDGKPTVYNVQKNTILGIAKALAVEGGPHDIRVNCISPGAIATEGMGAAMVSNRERILATNHKIPMGRRGRPEEVAVEILNLCRTSYTTGSERIVDGGFSLVAMPADYGPPKYRQVPSDPDSWLLHNE